MRSAREHSVRRITSWLDALREGTLREADHFVAGCAPRVCTPCGGSLRGWMRSAGEHSVRGITPWHVRFARVPPVRATPPWHVRSARVQSVRRITSWLDALREGSLSEGDHSVAGSL